MPPDKIKQLIISLFAKNVKGKSPDIKAANPKHAGKAGHWLEDQMNIAHNASNTPDIFGYEMKNNTTSGKITFGDWSPDYTIWKGKTKLITREEFIRIFGSPNPAKDNRYSWSGKPIPTINKYNYFGQILKVTSTNDIQILYNFSKDKRANKSVVVPAVLQKENLLIVQWSTAKIKRLVESKFNKLGWFKCIQNKDGVYSNIVFGKPITFERWIDGVKKGDIFFDSGMYEGNSRQYAQWRATNKYWDSLITEEH